MATYAIKWEIKVLVTIDNIHSLEWYKFIQEELSVEDEIKVNKKKDIENILSTSDQLNMIAEILDKLTIDSTDQYIIDAKKKFKDIKTILNK